MPSYLQSIPLAATDRSDALVWTYAWVGNVGLQVAVKECYHVVGTTHPLMSYKKAATIPGILNLPEAFRKSFKSSCKQTQFLRTTIASMLTSGFFIDMRDIIRV